MWKKQKRESKLAKQTLVRITLKFSHNTDVAYSKIYLY